MKLPYRLSAALVGTAMVAVQLPFSVAVAQDVSTIAEAITVRIDGPKAGGSGVIVKREGNTYTVLSNWHVVDDSGNYVIKTADARRHRVNSRRKLPGLDLAVLVFSSTQRYRVAELGNSENVSRNQSVYVSGWLNPIPGINERSYQFIEGKITSILSGSEDGGYALVYSNIGTYRGMSGGPLLNDRGQVVGINGRAAGDSLTGPVGLYLGIPINRFAGPRTAISSRPVPSSSNSTPREVPPSSQDKPEAPPPPQIPPDTPTAPIISKPKTRFFCGRDNGVPATIVRTETEEKVIIRWVSNFHGPNFTPQSRCEQVSRRFQLLYEKNGLKYLSYGLVNNYRVICVVEYRGENCTIEGMLFTLKPWDDPDEILLHLLEIREFGAPPLIR